MKSVVIDKTWDGRRLTRFLQKAMPSAGMGQIRKFLRLGRIKAGGKRASEETILHEGETVEMYVEDCFFEEVQREDPFYSKIRPKLTILYEDEHVMLLDKRESAYAAHVRSGVSLPEGRVEPEDGLRTRAVQPYRSLHRGYRHPG